MWKTKTMSSKSVEPDKQDRFCNLQHLSDAPAEHDHIAGNAHTRTARALVETIVNDNPGIRAVGLEGGWGSGKSSVIEIARKLLDDRKGAGPEYHLFTFDMWAHQGDPLRRSFLDKFVNWLRLRKRISDDQKQEWLDQLSAKITRTTTYTEPDFQPVGLVMLLLAPLLPLIYFWLSPVAFGDAANGVTFLGVDYKSWQSVLIGLLALPYVLVLYSLVTGKRMGQAVMLLSRDNDIEKVKQLVRDEDPTSVEFGNFLTSIINSSSGAKNKIIIVLDNLDRLPDDQISDAWAMMRGLIGREGDCAREESSKHVWLIVPYDKPHLQRALNDIDETVDQFRTDGFIEKTFDVVLRVSPPLLVHWRDYFIQRLDEAFSNAVNEAEKHKLHRILEYEFVDTKRAVTPRSVKAYINNIVSIVQQWREIVPIECVALYVLKKSTLETDLGGLIQGHLISDKYRALLGDVEWQKFLATLHYNVDPDDAYQVLIGASIEAALSNGEVEQLEQLSANPGFELVLGSLVHEKATNWATEDAVGFAVKCRTLFKAVEQTHPISEAWNGLGMAAHYLNYLTKFDVKTREGLTALISSLPKAGAIKCAAKLKERLSSAPEPDDSFDRGQQWLQSVDSINAALIEKAGDENRLSDIVIEGGAAFTCGVFSEFSKAKTLKLSNFKAKVNSDDFTAHISKYISDNEDSVDLEALLSLLIPGTSLINVENISSSLKIRLNTNSPALDARDAEILLRCLLVIESNKSSKVSGEKRLNELVSDGTLFALFMLGREKEEFGLSAAAFWCISLVQGVTDPPTTPAHPKFGDTNAARANIIQFRNDATSFDFEVGHVAKIVSQFHYMDKLIKLALETAKAESAFSCALKSAIIDGRYSKLLVNDVVRDFDKITDIIGSDASEKFAKRLAAWAGNLKPSVTRHISQGFMQAVHGTGLPAWDAVFSFVKDELEGMGQASWNPELEGENHPLELLLGMLKTKGIKLGPDFKLALQSHAERVFKEELMPVKYLNDWNLLPSALPPQTQRAFYKDLLLWLSDHSVVDGQLVRLFTMFPGFLENISVDKHPDAVVEKLFVPLVSNPNDVNIGVLKSNQGIFAKALSLAKKGMKELAQETIEGVFSSATGESENEIRVLAESLSLVLKEESDEDDGAK